MTSKHYRLVLDSGLRLRETADSTKSYLQWLRTAPQEHMVVIGYAHDQLIGSVTVAQGTVNSCPCNIGDIFAAVFAMNVSHFSILHNHPSGNTKAGEQDIAFTAKVREAGQLLRKPLLQSVILTATVP